MNISSESLYHMIDHLPVGVVVSDVSREDEPILYVNQAFTTITGFEPSEVLGRKCNFLQGESTDNQTVAKIRNSIDNGTPISIDILNYRRDGRSFWNRLSLFPLRQESKQLFAGFIQPIQAPHEAGAPQSQSLQDLLFRYSDDAVLLRDTEGRVLECNQAAVTTLGFTLAELQSSPQTQVMFPAHRSRENKELLDAVKRGETVSGVRTERMCGSQNMIQVKLSCAPIWNSEGQVSRILEIYQDMTVVARLKAENALLKSIVRFSEDGIISLDLSYRVTRWNQGATQIFSFEEGEVLGKNYLSFLVPQDDQEQTLASFQTILHDIKVEPQKTMRLDKGGESIPVLISKYPIKDDLGFITGFVLVIRNLTESILYQRALQEKNATIFHNEKLASLGQMAATIAHEINNPLQIISALSEDLQDLTEGVPEDDRKEYETLLSHIESVVFRTSKIISSLLLYSRDGSLDNIASHDINGIVKDTCEFCEWRFKRSNVLFIVKVQDEVMRVRCRPLELSQVIINLVNNAFDAIKDTDAAWVKVMVHQQGPSVVVSIVDSGKGISDEIAEHIFDPFFTTKPGGQGTGIGLGFAKKVLEAYGAELKLLRNGENTQFDIILPLVS
ncbi:PAS domain-containing protein [Pseudobacteriovorax antillogorgiicola]|uniref:histidine kinase n=1 Tax=Pseudobacteriovorax antillogorgiicola TaxID=1513793 RepID=A0A1Y6BI00_9BACT|nr:PAS domain-containing protein [Pseudobacteriovorax antillogorgiicola]TCS56463.1 PAS domain S-box-containing protein [Pseudobacteriovorax antillogorgiicola]SMF05176.1 PAS domain S-box-containing protein [Pseudobacteriovorax antillogorgiicola]